MREAGEGPKTEDGEPVGGDRQAGRVSSYRLRGVRLPERPVGNLLLTTHYPLLATSDTASPRRFQGGSDGGWCARSGSLAMQGEGEAAARVRRRERGSVGQRPPENGSGLTGEGEGTNGFSAWCAE